MVVERSNGWYYLLLEFIFCHVTIWDISKYWKFNPSICSLVPMLQHNAKKVIVVLLHCWTRVCLGSMSVLPSDICKCMLWSLFALSIYCYFAMFSNINTFLRCASILGKHYSIGQAWPYFTCFNVVGRAGIWQFGAVGAFTCSYKVEEMCFSPLFWRVIMFCFKS